MGVKGKYRKIKVQHEQLLTILNSSSEQNAKVNRKVLQFVLEKLQAELLQLELEVQKEKDELAKKADQQLLVEESGVDGEAQDHFKRLPEEIVEKILGHVKAPHDILSCSRTCQQFQTILGPRKAEWIFHQLLSVLTQSLAERGCCQQLNVLKLRQVCSDWRRAVDECIANAACDLWELERFTGSSRTEKEYYEILSGLHNFWPKSLMNSSEMLQRLMNKVETGQLSKTNPVQGKLLRFTPNSEEDPQLFWGNVKGLVEILGSHLSYCSLMLHDMDLSVSFHVLRNIWGHLTNLKGLKLSIYNRGDEGELLRSIAEDNSNPFPPLLHLISLDVLHMPAVFYQFVFPQQFKYLRKLEMGYIMGDVFPANSLMCDLPALEILICPSGDSLQWLMKLNSPVLKKLNFGFKYNEGENGCFRELFLALTRFSTTLRELELYGNQHKKITRGSGLLASQCALNCLGVFYRLQHLTIHYWPGSWDILLLMPALEYLNIECVPEYLCSKPQETETLDVIGFLDNMYKSNVWKLKVDLKEIKVQAYVFEGYKFYHYSRLGYEQEEERRLAFLRTIPVPYLYNFCTFAKRVFSSKRKTQNLDLF